MSMRAHGADNNSLLSTVRDLDRHRVESLPERSKIQKYSHQGGLTRTSLPNGTEILQYADRTYYERSSGCVMF